MKELLKKIFVDKNVTTTLIVASISLVVAIFVGAVQTGIFINQYKIANNANKIAAYQHRMEFYKKIVAANQQFNDISQNSGSFNQGKDDGSQIEYNGFKGIIKNYTYPDIQKPYTVFFPEPSYINVLVKEPIDIGIEAKFLFGDKNAKLITNWSNALCEYYSNLMVNSPYNNYKSQVDYRNNIKEITERYDAIMNDKGVQEMLDISNY